MSNDDNNGNEGTCNLSTVWSCRTRSTNLRKYSVHFFSCFCQHGLGIEVVRSHAANLFFIYKAGGNKGTLLKRVRWDSDPRLSNPRKFDWLRARRSTWLSYEPDPEQVSVYRRYLNETGKFYPLTFIQATGNSSPRCRA